MKGNSKPFGGVQMIFVGTLGNQPQCPKSSGLLMSMRNPCFAIMPLNVLLTRRHGLKARSVCTGLPIVIFMRLVESLVIFCRPFVVVRW